MCDPPPAYYDRRQALGGFDHRHEGNELRDAWRSAYRALFVRHPDSIEVE